MNRSVATHRLPPEYLHLLFIAYCRLLKFYRKNFRQYILIFVPFVSKLTSYSFCFFKIFVEDLDRLFHKNPGLTVGYFTAAYTQILKIRESAFNAVPPGKIAFRLPCLPDVKKNFLLRKSVVFSKLNISKSGWSFFVKMVAFCRDKNPSSYIKNIKIFDFRYSSPLKK